MILYFQACPKCEGTVNYLDDQDDCELKCINCGWRADTVTPSPEWKKESVKYMPKEA